MFYRTSEALTGYALDAPGTLEEVARLTGEWFGRHLHGRPDPDVHPAKGA